MQTELFHETIEDAQGSDIAACGGFKAVARVLFPNKSPSGGYAYLKNALAEDKAEKLGPEDLAALIKMARNNGSTATVDFICDSSGLSRPKIVYPEEERASLQQSAVVLAKDLNTIVTRLERLNGCPGD